MPPPPDGPLTAELFVRSLAPRNGRDRLESAVRRLSALEEDGTLARVEVRVTGDAIPASPGESVTATGAILARRFRAFCEWATATERTLPGFDRRCVHSAYTGEDYDAVAPPALCLAEFEAGRLRFVSPCTDGVTPVAVEDRLAALEARTTRRDTRTADAQPRPVEPVSDP